jgi:hypothetical protein
LLIAELPYAHETVGTYDKVSFIDPYDAKGLANKMKSLMDGTFNFSGAVTTSPESPFVSNWRELLMLLTAN